ncbi:MAG: type II toxin-antitoxin system VapC family toxin [Bryobacteraceae bacterium]
MTTAIDTNVIISLWDQDEALSSTARSALEKAFRLGNLIVAAPVFSELMAGQRRTEQFLDSFLRETGISVEWVLDQAVWRLAGRAFQTYAATRRMRRDSGPRRIPADFVIGAHAMSGGFNLLTFDGGIHRKAFPGIRITEL